MKESIPLASNARERFLLAIADVVSVERLAELHIFPPMRQGPMETGVAVIAAEPEVVAEADAPLVTVEAVVKGVQARANEVVEPDRLSGDEARALIVDARCRITP